ncbi:hypothetical protein BCR34DRAFT_597811 [Clohesyomyces aquaticus]|uniref:DUF7707 domain-containing protein n=1 Tax=Clohesyomyces aquaticus TaxID=1231657 RepID=A0A1Y2A1S6_9PLEO|nr:hypothetical protein BCR34DRAFT_597811 [Clohesyomyces aquaticus]
MLFNTLIVAASAFAGVAFAQNDTGLPPSVQPCCTLDAGTINQANRTNYCTAQRQTCPAICGGQGHTKAGNDGNFCDITTLKFSCICQDGKTPNMSDYQQSVPGLMCREWFDRCIIASGDNLDEQIACKAVTCGNKTAELNSASTSSAAPSSTGGAPASSGGAGASPTSSGPAAASSTGAAAALAIAREYGTPILAGGIAAIFGLAL